MTSFLFAYLAKLIVKLRALGLIFELDLEKLKRNFSILIGEWNFLYVNISE